MNDSHVELLILSLQKTDQDVRELRDDIQTLREEIKDLNAFRWKIYGIASVLSSIIAFGLNIFFQN